MTESSQMSHRAGPRMFAVGDRWIYVSASGEKWFVQRYGVVFTFGWGGRQYRCVTELGPKTTVKVRDLEAMLVGAQRAASSAEPEDDEPKREVPKARGAVRPRVVRRGDSMLRTDETTRCPSCPASIAAYAVSCPRCGWSLSTHAEGSHVTDLYPDGVPDT